MDFTFLTYEMMMAAGVFLLSLLVLLVVRTLVSRMSDRLAAKTNFRVFTYTGELARATSLLFLLAVSILLGLTPLDLSEQHSDWAGYAWIVISIWQVALWANRAISVGMDRALERSRINNPAGATHLMVLGLIGRIVLWSVALLAMLDNLGFNITTLMASLGIGGIAVALAVQNILGDIFSSISIALDKPFVIGDFIIVDDFLGTVEYVGLKTTRLRSLGGEQIIFSNAELLKCRIRNYKQMRERRVLFGFRIAYETPPEMLEKIPVMVRAAVESQADTRFDRAHFKGFEESALSFEVVYYVLKPDYNTFMDVQQEINLILVRKLRDLEVEFGYPYQIIHFKGDMPPAPVAAANRQAPVEQ